MVAVRCYLRYGPSYRDVEELLVLDELIPSAWTTSSGTPIIRLRRIMISLSIIGYG